MDDNEYILGWAGKEMERLSELVTTLRAENERLVTALSFYADTTRYYGPNRRLDEPDEWSEQAGLVVYRLDVTRDSGAIARAALNNDSLAAKGE